MGTMCMLVLTLYNVVAMLVTHVPVARRHAATMRMERLLGMLGERDAHVKVIGESVVYDRYARVYSRDVRFQDGKVHSFDVWGRVWKNNSFSVVAVVPFDCVSQTFTLIREFNPAHGRHVYSFPQGMVERTKHVDIRAAAAAELEEEAHLKCREWTPLFDAQSGGGGGGVPQDKYQREVVYFYLCADAVGVTHAAHLDAEEDIEIVSGVTPSQFKQLSHAGALQSNNIAAGLLAMDQLRQMNLIPLSS